MLGLATCMYITDIRCAWTPGYFSVVHSVFASYNKAKAEENKSKLDVCEIYCRMWLHPTTATKPGRMMNLCKVILFALRLEPYPNSAQDNLLSQMYLS